MGKVDNVAYNSTLPAFALIDIVLWPIYNFSKWWPFARNVPDIWPNCDFQDGGRPRSWISFTRVRTTHEEYLVVFVTAQNLVVIGAVISIVCKF